VFVPTRTAVEKAMHVHVLDTALLVVVSMRRLSLRHLVTGSLRCASCRSSSAL
jgi:hypothetical protein